ncbi:unnamed protein product [Rangifer tarandus platyrhynchus]|uniref:Uncharacterized protein n=2 Tax=Rangifer tarandus platyrhynchus TaxID=3082113 RepID=A0ABN9A0G3_RANTA|nr:unnamed protein product [Rangifer tarandus platyrhynchus]
MTHPAEEQLPLRVLPRRNEGHLFPGGSAGKEFACNAGNLGLIPGLGRCPWRRERLSTPVFWSGEFHGLYSPRGHKEPDTTERLSLSLFSLLFMTPMRTPSKFVCFFLVQDAEPPRVELLISIYRVNVTESMSVPPGQLGSFTALR